MKTQPIKPQDDASTVPLVPPTPDNPHLNLNPEP